MIYLVWFLKLLSLWNCTPNYFILFSDCNLSLPILTYCLAFYLWCIIIYLDLLVFNLRRFLSYHSEHTVRIFSSFLFICTLFSPSPIMRRSSTKHKWFTKSFWLSLLALVFWLGPIDILGNSLFCSCLRREFTYTF